MSYFKGILLLGCLMVSVQLLHAQVAVSGIIKDSTGKPLQSVSITLKKGSGIILGFAITNTTGAYKIQYAKASVKDTLFVEANAVGFKKQTIAVTKAVQVIDVALVSSVVKLPNVVVKSKPMLRREGDTLNYDVESFSNKQDRTIGDIIKKLPGVEVSDKGEITVGGKAINRFYIDGDNLLDGKYNIATKSIPNDMVSKVQVLENHQPIKALQGAVASEDPAMNIVLKDKARLKIMGTGDAALGTPDAYNGSVNAMLFQKQVKFINYIKANNMGVDLADETINHFGYDNQPPSNLVSAGTAGSPDLFKKRYLFNNVGLVNVNDLINLKNEYQLRINAFYLFDRQYQNSQYSSTYFLPTDTIRYSEIQESRTKTNTFNTQFTLTANKKNYYLNNVTTLENTPSDVIASLQATTNNNISQQLNGTTTNITNRFNYVKRTTGRMSWEAYSLINHIENPATLQVEPGLYAAQFNAGNPFAALIQHAAIPTFYTDNYVTLRSSTQRFQQEYKIGVNYQDQRINSLLESEQLNGVKAAVADSFINRFHWDQLRAYVQTTFTYTDNRLMLRASLPLTLQDTKYTGRLVDVHTTHVPMSPRLYMKYNVGRESYFTVNYTYNNSWANSDQAYDGYVMKSYRNFYTNSTLLTETQRHAVNLAYNFRNTLKIFFFSLGANYGAGQSNTINDTRLSSVIQQSYLIPFTNLSHTSTVFGNISKYIFSLQTTLGAKASWNQSVGTQLLNGDVLQVQNDSYTAGVSVITKFTDWMNMLYNGAYTTYGSKQNSSSHGSDPAAPNVKKWQHELGVNVNITSNFYWKFSGENYNYHIPGAQDNNYTFIDAGATYKLDKLKTDIELSMTNLANIDTYSSASLSSNSIVQSSYRIRPRMVMLKFYFRF